MTCEPRFWAAQLPHRSLYRGRPLGLPVGRRGARPILPPVCRPEPVSAVPRSDVRRSRWRPHPRLRHGRSTPHRHRGPPGARAEEAAPLARAGARACAAVDKSAQSMGLGGTAPALRAQPRLEDSRRGRLRRGRRRREARRRRVLREVWLHAFRATRGPVRGAPATNGDVAPDPRDQGRRRTRALKMSEERRLRRILWTQIRRGRRLTRVRPTEVRVPACKSCEPIGCWYR